MQVGHINLHKYMNGNGEHFVRLIEGLDRLHLKQHIVVRNESLARRLKVCDGVTVGPTARTPVTAYCLMPKVDVVHAHDEAGGHAGLLLTLTQSIPYVVTRRSALPPGANPIIRSVYGRAIGLICPSELSAAAISGSAVNVPVDVISDISASNGQHGEEIVAAHLRVYRRAARTARAMASI